MLVPAGAHWRGTEGTRMTKAEFADHVTKLKLNPATFNPQFVVLHNTASPDSKQWKSSPVPQRLVNLTDYYKGKGWHGGPHCFVDDQYIWLFTPLNQQGTHTPSWNKTAWGIEMVGDYAREPFNSGFGAKVRDNAAFVLATLLKKLHKQATSETIRFHKEDLKTDHDCPGKYVVKSDVLERVATLLRVPSPSIVPAVRPGSAKQFTVTMTEFGGSDDPQDSAYGGKVNGGAMELSLPCKLPENRRNVRVSLGERSVVGRVNDLGPWNKTDAYWDKSGRPAAETQMIEGTVAENGMVPVNNAGIDGTPPIFDALGVIGKRGTRSARVTWMFTDEQPTPAPKEEIPPDPDNGEHETPPVNEDDIIEPKKLIKSKTFWGSVVAGASSVLAYVSDWKVVATICTAAIVVACILIIYWRWSREDIK